MVASEPPLPVPSPIRVVALVLLAVFAVEGAIMVGLAQFPHTWRDSPVASLIDAIVLTLVVAPAVWLAVVRPLRRLFDARGRLLQRLFDAQEQERGRVARELHDGLGQQLTALMVGLRAVEDVGDLETARGRVHALRDLASHAHADVRRLSRGLHPVVLDELGLASAIERLGEELERIHRVKVVLQLDSLPRLAPATEAAIYRIVQEATSNIARHARADRIEIGLTSTAESIALSVRDNGRGFDPASKERGFGLASMSERALMLGGKLVVHTSPGNGTAIEARFPITRAASDG